MKQPNDKKRPNSNTAKETRDRKRNFKYVWVSKRLFEVPVFNDDGSLTNIKQIVVEKKGHTYRRPTKKRISKRAFGRKYGWKLWWDLRAIGVGGDQP